MLGSSCLVILDDYQINCLFSNRQLFVIPNCEGHCSCFNFIEHNLFAVGLFPAVCDDNDDDDDDVLVVLILRAVQCTRHQ